MRSIKSRTVTRNIEYRGIDLAITGTFSPGSASTFAPGRYGNPPEDPMFEVEYVYHYSEDIQVIVSDDVINEISETVLKIILEGV